MKTEHFEAARHMFNGIRPMRGQMAGLATADPEGRPNIAPVGSMRVVDENTIHLLQGFLPMSMQNLKSNPAVVFAVWRKPSLKGIFESVAGGKGVTAGYRIYATYNGMSENAGEIAAEIEHLLTRLPRMARRPLRRFFLKNISRLLRFSIDDIRPV